MSLSKLATLVVFAWLLAWPGLPWRQCPPQVVARSCCSTPESNCACKPKLCNCKKSVGQEVAFPTLSSPLVWLRHPCLVQGLLQGRQVAASVVPTRRLYEARGPTQRGLTAFQIALPPPA